MQGLDNDLYKIVVQTSSEVGYQLQNRRDESWTIESDEKFSGTKNMIISKKAFEQNIQSIKTAPISKETKQNSKESSKTKTKKVIFTVMDKLTKMSLDKVDLTYGDINGVVHTLNSDSNRLIKASFELRDKPYLLKFVKKVIN